MKGKIYEPVREFERQTSYCPLYLAWRIVDEARDYFRTDIPEAFADKLARRAEAVFAKHPFIQREFKSAAGRGTILVFMRHWLASVLAKENPVLYHQPPESFKIGGPLPQKPRGSGRESAPSDQSRFTSAATVSKAGSRGSAFARLRRDKRAPRQPAMRFVHGCELLTL